uniref:ornithine decarboxylase n=1 Tax=Sphaeramia orbicularis TaxID=375764 RepID=A0A672YKF8_9TELE
MDLCDIEILDTTKTISDFINDKIKERHSVVSIPDIIYLHEVSFHVANLDDLHQKHIRWLRTLPRVKPFYAVKCNSTPAVIRMLSTLGTGFDCASKGEIELVLSLGVTPEKIIFAHTTKPQSHIKYASTRGVDMMTFDCEEELLKISACHTRAKLVLRIAVDDSKSAIKLSQKFGTKPSVVKKLLERCKELDLEVIGVSFHVGSGCTDSLAYRQAIEDARHVFDTAVLLGFQMRLLDIGGGFPGKEGFQIQFDEFSKVINEALDEFFPADSGVQVIAEPGRYYVDSAFTLAVNVFAKKVVMDDSSSDPENDRVMMYYISDGVFGSLNCLISYPAHTNVAPGEKRYRSIIWGPTCSSVDRVTATYWMPEVQVGDWLLIDNMGAYSVCCSSDFNCFYKAHVYPVLSAQTWNITPKNELETPLPLQSSYN